ncbi:sulfotransferase [Aliifodinibius sp. S!AR15-10]|uniref:sulfotransferase domain-containing protein n=1 Tax=Aliifodinibius sp. S!AR15-10 TaxID=2950437 RepID=UPI002863EFCC|nr:sulfotransferase domain-containing protein [Aliifodinibius sp. S!AR15-10]MDR8392614.1 sulfotransferase [Aliifodinibius sp. S!AR15-10]
MSFKEKILRILRRLFYGWHRKAEKRYRQLNRALLRSLSGETDPIASAPLVTNRRTSEEWRSLSPLWVLSTGRTGTNTLTELFRLSPKIDAYHEPSPELFQLSHDYFMENINDKQALLALMYARDEWVFRSFRDGYIYVETNNRVTYLSDLLQKLFPKSKFLYLHRNPYDFIRSGMRRRYYEEHLRDADRITPMSGDEFYDEWQSFSTIEKVAWNWRTVNQHSIDFLADLPDKQKMVLSSESLFNADKTQVDALFDFIVSADYRPSYTEAQKVLDTKHNAQKEGAFSKPGDWTDEQIAGVDRIIRPVAEQLSYKLFSSSSSEPKLHSK